jgi:hypothetical protein
MPTMPIHAHQTGLGLQARLERQAVQKRSGPATTPASPRRMSNYICPSAATLHLPSAPSSSRHPRPPFSSSSWLRPPAGDYLISQQHSALPARSRNLDFIFLFFCAVFRPLFSPKECLVRYPIHARDSSTPPRFPPAGPPLVRRQSAPPHSAC